MDKQWGTTISDAKAVAGSAPALLQEGKHSRPNPAADSSFPLSTETAVPPLNSNPAG